MPALRERPPVAAPAPEAAGRAGKPAGPEAAARVAKPGAEKKGLEGVGVMRRVKDGTPVVLVPFTPEVGLKAKAEKASVEPDLTGLNPSELQGSSSRTGSRTRESAATVSDYCYSKTIVC